jgi:hypothetical protein
VRSVYHPNTDTWTRVPTGPLDNHVGTVTLLDGQLLVLGSNTKGAARAAVWNPNTTTWTSLPNAPHGCESPMDQNPAAPSTVAFGGTFALWCSTSVTAPRTGLLFTARPPTPPASLTRR